MEEVTSISEFLGNVTMGVALVIFIVKTFTFFPA